MNKVLSNKEVKEVINKNFLYYEINVLDNNYFNELIYSCLDDYFLVLRNDSIVSILFSRNNPSLFIEKLNNYTIYPFELLINKLSFLQGKGENVARAINKILSLQYKWDKKAISFSQFMEGLAETIKIQPYFYNRYLQAYNNDFQNTSCCDILDSLSTFEKKLYGKYIRDIMAKKNAIDTCVRANILFEGLKYDFGKIERNQKKSGVFIYQNIGSVPYLIYDIETSCGCTVVKWSGKPLLPGDIDTVRVEFISPSLGFFEKFIKIKDNSKQKEIELKIKGEIVS